MISWIGRNRQTAARALGSILALALLVVLLQEKGDGEMFSAMRRVSIGYFLTAVIALLVSRLFAVLRWHVLLRSAGVGLSFLRSVMLTFTGNFSSNFMPTTIGGDVVRLTGAMQIGYDRAVCLASLVADRLIGMAGMAVVLPLGLGPFFTFSNGASLSLAFPALIQKGMDFARRTFESLSIWLKKPTALFGSLLATLGNQIFIYLMVYLLLLGIDHKLSFWLVAGMYTLSYFVTLIPISINGLGVQELSLTFLLTRLGGLSPSESATIAVLVRAIFIITSLPGAFFLPSILAAMNEKQATESQK